MKLTDELRTEAQRRNIQETEDLREVIVEKIVEIYHQEDDHSEAMNIEDGRLNVILMVGVNGVGKTTTIGKLAYRYQQEGKKVMLAAGDTFRAGAIQQLNVWGERVGVEVVSQNEGSDPAAVVPDAPHEALLCLDATTGQNALSQARSFKEVTNVSGIVLTKLDGTAKGGIVLAIRNELHIPVKYVGLGEKMDDLQPFNPESYVYGLFADMIEQNEDIPEEISGNSSVESEEGN